MAIYGAQVGVSNTNPNLQSSACSSSSGCIDGVNADFYIKRHDTKPPFRIAIEDCDGAMDLDDDLLVAEVNMWAYGKLKSAITNTDSSFQLADNIGFEQALIGDIIVMDRVRQPEHMLIVDFDEANHLVHVSRGYNGTTPVAWDKGKSLRIFRVLNGSAEINLVTEDVLTIEGTTETQLSQSLLVYEWQPNDTCVPGCFWLEFKLLKMVDPSKDVSSVSSVISSIPSTASLIPSNIDEMFGCVMGTGVEWVRRFPVCGDAFLIQIKDSPTAEM